MGQLSRDDVQFALELARKHGYAEVTLTDDASQFTAELLPAPKSPRSAAATTDSSATTPAPKVVKSNFVGWFRAAPPAIQVGDPVTVGQVVGSVETLGLLNDVESKVAGRVTEVLVAEDESVDFGNELFTVEP
jgi:acetyl-CoA carboxylase biotin carboxyl carrier protein